MNKTEILVVGNDGELVEKIVSIINDGDERRGIAAFTDEEAITKFHQYQIDLVLLTADVSDGQERKLQKLFTFQNPDVVITRIADNNESVVRSVITGLMKKDLARRNFSFVLVDDALKNVGLNIRVL